MLARLAILRRPGQAVGVAIGLAIVLGRRDYAPPAGYEREATVVGRCRNARFIAVLALTGGDRPAIASTSLGALFAGRDGRAAHTAPPVVELI